MSAETAQSRVPVSILILAWNSAAHLPHCLAALSLQTYKDFEIVIVDNGSKDDALNDLHERYPALQFRIHRLESNLGFSAANNIGARLARGQWLTLLNADAFPEPDWLEHLLEAAKRYPGAFFTSRQIQADDPSHLDGEGDVYHVSGLAWRRNYNSPVNQTIEQQEVFSACGAAAMFPRQAFLEAGGFDEDYFSYHEDVDLGFRLRLRGLRCIFVPQAVVHHVGSASTGKKSSFAIYHGHRNLVWTFFKDMPSTLFWLYLPLHIAVNIFFLIYFTLNGQGRAIWRAKWDALRGLPAVIKKRQSVQRGRKVSIRELHGAMSRNWLTPFITALNRKNR